MLKIIFLKVEGLVEFYNEVYWYTVTHKTRIVNIVCILLTV